MNLDNSFARIYDAPPTSKEAIGDSDPAIERLARNFFHNAETISQSNRRDINQCKKSLFARVIKQLNQHIPKPFILPIELSVQTNPTNPDRWDWKKWQSKANRHVQSDYGYDAIEDIGKKIGLNDARNLLLDFFQSIDPSSYNHITIENILTNNEEPFKAVSLMMQGRVILPKEFIITAISRGLVDEELINEIYTQHIKNKASSSTGGASNSEISSNQLEVNAARDLAEEFFTTAKVSGSNTHAHRSKLMHQFTSILNETYLCDISVMGVNPGQFGNNPTEVMSDWSEWQKAVYKKKGECWKPRNETTIDDVEDILRCNLTQNMLYTAFRSSPDILDFFEFDFSEIALKSEDLLHEVFSSCRCMDKPVTKIITGLIESGCLTQETIDAIYSLARK